MSSLRGERGGILVVAAITMPAILLLTALVLDAGRWYTHKRSLQNRADAGALAAGVEYLSQLANCAANPTGPAATAIADKARLYAGATGTGYNETVNNQAEVTVKINATGPAAADNSDGGNPCQDHAPDGISPSGGIWTDVIARETNIRTVAGAFGINLPTVAARARVELGQITTLNGGLPFVNETGDQIECVWAQFVRARDNSPTAGFSVTPSNPVLLTKTGTGTWSADITDLDFTNAHDDVAIRYYAGSKDGNAPCDFSTDNKSGLPHDMNAQNPISVDWINVYDTGRSPGADEAPKLRRFALTSSTCGGSGFVYTASTDPNATCLLGFSAEVDTGPNRVRGTISVQPIQVTGSGIATATGNFDTTGGGAGPNLSQVTGTITIRPNQTATGTGFTQDYTQVGEIYFKVGWRQTTGRVGNGNNGNCANGGSNCSGTFAGETVSGVGSDIQQKTFVADPLLSTPMVGTSSTLTTTSYPALGQTGAFTITFEHQAVDKEHVVLIRDSVQGSGNRTLAIWCGGPNSGANSLKDAIINGCQRPLTLNTRGDVCTNASSMNPLDCVQVEQGNKTGPVREGTETRFGCTPNNWVTGGPLPPDGDPRWAYIPLTGYGRMYAVPNNGWLPIEGFIRIYVTGKGGKNFTACAYDEDPPRGTDDKGAQIWGHLVSPVTLDGSVVIGNAKCNLTLDNIQCKPALVR